MFQEAFQIVREFSSNAPGFFLVQAGPAHFIFPFLLQVRRIGGGRLFLVKQLLQTGNQRYCGGYQFDVIRSMEQLRTSKPGMPTTINCGFGLSCLRVNNFPVGFYVESLKACGKFFGDNYAQHRFKSIGHKRDVL